MLVFIGGGIGSILRYSTTIIFSSIEISFPLATFISNVLASLLIGFVAGKFSSSTYLFIAVGICGGWSTFSSFSLDTFKLMNEGKTGLALLNISANVIVCYLFLWLGIILSKNI